MLHMFILSRFIRKTRIGEGWSEMCASHVTMYIDPPHILGYVQNKETAMNLSGLGYYMI